MRFSWTALILAPLLAPVVFTAAGLFSIQADETLQLFLILIIPSALVSYGTTVFLFLPALYLVSQRTPMTVPKACLLGLVLGVAAHVVVSVLVFIVSGPESGPPGETFLQFFRHWSAEWVTLVYPVAGLVTAGLYWWLASRASSAKTPEIVLPKQ